jgi:hypothetical protein
MNKEDVANIAITIGFCIATFLSVCIIIAMGVGIFTLLDYLMH